MALKTLIFGTDDLYPALKSSYNTEVRKGNLKIVGYAVLENGEINIYTNGVRKGRKDNSTSFEVAVVSSQNDFRAIMKFFEEQGMPRKNILDGRAFEIPDFDFQKLMSEGVAYGTFDSHSFAETQNSRFTVYPKVYTMTEDNLTVKLGRKSFIVDATITGNNVVIETGNFCSISEGQVFEFSDDEYNCDYLVSYDLKNFDWQIPEDVFVPKKQETLQIIIGNDVRIGRGCILKSKNPEKPLTIGDGAIIASDSIVTEDVPPYESVGGNPAKIIIYRFSEKIIESLLRIKWWNWDIDKIYDNFKYFNDIEKFVEMHDKGV